MASQDFVPLGKILYEEEGPEPEYESGPLTLILRHSCRNPSRKYDGADEHRIELHCTTLIVHATPLHERWGNRFVPASKYLIHAIEVESPEYESG